MYRSEELYEEFIDECARKDFIAQTCIDSDVNDELKNMHRLNIPGTVHSTTLLQVLFQLLLRTVSLKRSLPLMQTV